MKIENFLTGPSDLAVKRGIMTISVSARNTDIYRPIPIIGKMANYRPIPIPILLSVEHYHSGWDISAFGRFCPQTFPLMDSSASGQFIP